MMQVQFTEVWPDGYVDSGAVWVDFEDEAQEWISRTARQLRSLGVDFSCVVTSDES